MEKTDTSRSRSSTRERRIKLPDGKIRYASTDAKEIAAELRAKSKLGVREARLKAAEGKLHG